MKLMYHNIRFYIIMSDRKIQYKIISLNLVVNAINKDFQNTNNICELCKCSLYEQSVIVGKCHHAFHTECFNKISTISCPIDNTIWIEEYNVNKKNDK